MIASNPLPPNVFLEVPAEWEVLPFPDGSLVFNGFSGRHLRLKRPHRAVKRLFGSLDPGLPWGELRQLISRNSGCSEQSVEEAAVELIRMRLIRARDSRSMSDHAGWSRFKTQLEWLEQYADDKNTPERMLDSLRNALITVIGLGGTGSFCAMMLAACGVGRLRLVDGDRVELSNLVRQVFYSEKGSIDRLKSEEMKKRIREFSALTEVESIPRFIESESDAAAVIRGSQFVLLCADAPRVLINRRVNSACVDLGIPYINAFSGSVGPVFLPGRSACFTCFEEHLRARMGDDYDDMVAALQTRRTRQYPSFIGGVPQTAQIQFMECFAVITGAWNPRTINRVLKPDYHRIESEEIARRLECPTCGKSENPSPEPSQENFYV